ncbi:hypothetical protein [Algoriphagus halophilus]|uniref:Mobilization protein n=1 Tax=Algoriphagus halophilus TaxID=226505 RepID=A0A1N6E6B6_9BACT|nr:hypothetical protein [Algoriphagus halophilus]SIN78536.1 hypothetical protein SAMN05444394_1765 [Algoriphagus halophilus]
MAKHKKDFRNNRCEFRMNDREMNQIKEKFHQSIHSNFSEFVRYRLFKKPVFAGVRDTGMEDLLKELVPLKEELLEYLSAYRQQSSTTEVSGVNKLDFDTTQHQQLVHQVEDSLTRLNRVLDQTVTKWLQS